MPEKATRERAKADKKAGKAPSTQAGEYVREEMDHVKEGKHGVRSRKQAIAIGLSKARRDGVDMKPPKKGTTSEATRKKAEQDSAKSHAHKKVSARRSAATTKALKGEPKTAVKRKRVAKK